MLKRTISALALAAAGSAGATDFAPFMSAGANMVQGYNGFSVSPLFTVGETLPNGYRPVGTPDGIGAYARDASTVRVFVNHEISAANGYAYTLSNGTPLTGARVSYFDIDRASRSLVGGGLAYSKVYDRTGADVTSAAQVSGGFTRFCSAQAFEPDSFGTNKGIRDRIFFTGEETTNGTLYALDTATSELHAVPSFGRANWENVAQVNTGSTSKVAFIIGDDTVGASQLLYVGTKSGDTNASFLARNGLQDGKVYAWKADGGDLTAATFNGNAGDARSGSWTELTVRDTSKASTLGYDAQGYADAATLQAQAHSLGAFGFARPEDVATNKSDGTLVAFTSTGRDNFNGGADTWGIVYTQKVAFDADGNPVSGTVTIAYNGNNDSTHALRSPDNLDWSDDGHLLVQEDRAADWNLASNPNQADGGILRVGLDGTVETVARIVRNVFPIGQIDTFPGIAGIGEWETSGILDVSSLFGLVDGRLFIGDVQAHGIKLGSSDLSEGGQLFLLASNVPEPASWALMVAGFGLVGSSMRRRVRNVTYV